MHVNFILSLDWKEKGYICDRHSWRLVKYAKNFSRCLKIYVIVKVDNAFKCCHKNYSSYSDFTD